MGTHVLLVEGDEVVHEATLAAALERLGRELFDVVVQDLYLRGAL